jgi:antitoxin component YwqK of YwqJK toxin-antitoxin module
MEDFTGELVQPVENGHVVISYKLGKKDGITRFVDKTEAILSEINYKEDVIDGEIRNFYPT